MSDPAQTRERGGASYTCPRCSEPTRVLATRLRPRGVIRCRECTNPSCGEIFDTMERITVAKNRDRTGLRNLRSGGVSG